ncbi:hypothetical protein NSK_003758 [Nannochloropsis salina CCMP1776]|uniref:PH domain-containing protein n=1 Tax=Nannochloropsis salina CCMP1776 TaxID=1027361 RepID=A0A4D9D074_9STRA|nr:hypothetical protein NSK_003758 [Nannochloropsis salina CCMP1776]|eukprot:TFJ84726.1 hypothetical protein NSK_003758 [Nannochloropsis salina CCMP1776]
MDRQASLRSHLIQESSSGCPKQTAFMKEDEDTATTTPPRQVSKIAMGTLQRMKSFSSAIRPAFLRAIGSDKDATVLYAGYLMKLKKPSNAPARPASTSLASPPLPQPPAPAAVGGNQTQKMKDNAERNPLLARMSIGRKLPSPASPLRPPSQPHPPRSPPPPPQQPHLIRRFVVLTPTSLRWYKREENDEDVGELLGRVLLKDIKDLVLPPSPSPSLPPALDGFPFEVVCGSRRRTFVAVGEDEREAWVLALEAARTKVKEERLLPDSSRRPASAAGGGAGPPSLDRDGVGEGQGSGGDCAGA